jgi:predicted nuclease of predicted toxin-antitoxin system
MKLLLDQGLPRSTAALLRAAGFDTVHTAEIGLATADDAVILARGLTEDRVVVTLDADFHRLMADSGATQPSVIRVRVEGHKADAMAQLLRTVVGQFENELKQGALLSVQETSVRVRLLPLTS